MSNKNPKLTEKRIKLICDKIYNDKGLHTEFDFNYITKIGRAHV